MSNAATYWDRYEGHQSNVTATDESCRKHAAYALGKGDRVNIVAGPYAGREVLILVASNAGFNGMSFWVDAGGAQFNVYGSQVQAL